MTHSSELFKPGRTMRFRPKYKKQVSLPVDIGRLTNHQQVGLPAPVNWTPMRYNGSKSRTQLERVSNEDEANKERDFAKEEDAGKDSSSADDCAQVGLQLRTIADTWNRTYFENDDFHRQHPPQLGVFLFIVVFQMCA